jgi:hypothetical protein
MRNGFNSTLIRIAAVIAGLLFVGICLRLLLGILQPVLPGVLMLALQGGWDMLLSIVSPALPAIAAVGILAALVWALSKRH